MTLKADAEPHGYVIEKIIIINPFANIGMSSNLGTMLRISKVSKC